MTTVATYAHIVRKPRICGGLPHIEGTRIRVLDVVALHKRGLSPAEILDSLEDLTLAQVHSALAYYYDHEDEIEQEFRQARRLVEGFRADKGSGAFIRPLASLRAGWHVSGMRQIAHVVIRKNNIVSRIVPNCPNRREGALPVSANQGPNSIDGVPGIGIPYGGRILRRRECRNCGRRICTYERSAG